MGYTGNTGWRATRPREWVFMCGRRRCFYVTGGVCRGYVLCKQGEAGLAFGL